MPGNASRVVGSPLCRHDSAILRLAHCRSTSWRSLRVFEQAFAERRYDLLESCACFDLESPEEDCTKPIQNTLDEPTMPGNPRCQVHMSDGYDCGSECLGSQRRCICDISVPGC